MSKELTFEVGFYAPEYGDGYIYPEIEVSASVYKYLKECYQEYSEMELGMILEFDDITPAQKKNVKALIEKLNAELEDAWDLEDRGGEIPWDDLTIAYNVQPDDEWEED